jgi:hypothetical protein
MMEANGRKTRKHEQQQRARESSSAASVPPVAAGVALQDLQQSAGNHTVSEWLQAGPPLIQMKSNNGGSPDAAEQQADKVAENATPSPQVTPAKALIVDDAAKQLQPGQMGKSEFLSALRSSVCSAAEQSLADTMWSSMGCPYIDRWFSYYSNQSGTYVERALLKYAPEAASAQGAHDYIPIVTQQVRQGIGEWKETGEVTGLPAEFAGGEMPGASVSGLASSAVAEIGSTVSGAVSGIASSIGLKGRTHASGEVNDPVAIQAQLGPGQSLNSGVKSKMEDAFGMTFSGVRVHTDSKARELSTNLDARAFTIGNDIAFAAGEYQPDSLIGDALIAHELAHVAQQSGGNSPTPLGKGGTEYNSLEEDADVSAVGAMMSTLIGAKGRVTGISKQAMPRVRSGLRLQRCNSKKGHPDPKRFEEIKKILETIPTGKEALKIMEKYNVGVRFEAGSGTVYRDDGNYMVIDSSESTAEAALSFVHEIHHAKTENEKTEADVKALGREEYIKKEIEEEAEGTVKSIEAHMELEGTKIDVSKASFPLEAEYRAAYKTAVDAAKAADPKISEEQLKKVGREAGLKRVIKGFTEGEVHTSDKNITYREHYGKLWDNAH